MAYNLWPVSPIKMLLARFDQAAIFLFIAGSYTPFLAVIEGTTTGVMMTTSWLAAKTKTSGREASRSTRRAKVIEALPGLGDALSAGEISPAHVDVVAGIVPEKLWAKAASLVAAAKSLSPEELEQAAHQLLTPGRQRLLTG
jgi:hypothetical protein